MTSSSAAYACPHCLAPVAAEGVFCCPGCEGAYHLIHQLGLARYYQQRTLSEEEAPPTPEAAADPEAFTRFVTMRADGTATLHLRVEGLHCAACVWLIEHVLAREPEILEARLNMTTRRLTLRWRGAAERGGVFAGIITSLGYRVRPYDPAEESNLQADEQRDLLRCLAVAGFAAGNIMLLSVALWSTSQEVMGIATRDLLHWISALIAMPTVLYAGRPFFRSAFAALRHRRTNMDVPISLALVGATAMSLFETITHGEHAYFDSAVMLVFFLLIGRYLDRRARNRALSAAQDLLALLGSTATVLVESAPRFLPVRDLAPGMVLLVAPGERIAADGRVQEGNSNLDTSLITGESLPRPTKAGDTVFAGTINLDAPLNIEVTATQEDSLLAEIVRLMERAAQKQARYVRLADRVARLYTPVVHVLGLATFLIWWLGMGMPWQVALLRGITVLLVTCPCALALAVPVVQVIASGRLFARGILLKSGDALERLAAIDTVVFDKTGTLTLGQPELVGAEAVPQAVLEQAASLAAASRHPLAKALLRASPHAPVPMDARELPGYGVEAVRGTRILRLGRRSWVAPQAHADADAALELWFDAGDGMLPHRFTFRDQLRRDAASTLATLRHQGLELYLLSGDRASVAQDVAAQCGITHWQAEQKPDEKAALLNRLREEGHYALMVGDGMNDAPALASAYVSMSPSSAIDLTQNAADIVFQGEKLSPVAEAWKVARKAQMLVKQNITFALLYNVVAVPMAVAGMITPLAAAIAMSSSSLVVIVNALRLR